jgi:hypothetical protein
MQQMSGLLEKESDVVHGSYSRGRNFHCQTTEAQARFPVNSATLIELFVPDACFVLSRGRAATETSALSNVPPHLRTRRPCC